MKNTLKIMAISLMYSSINFGYYSQCGQDEYVAHIFKNARNGYYADIGAHDGKQYSNTKHFDEVLDWQGICVEPLPDIYEKLKNNRPNALCINACVADKTGTFQFLRIINHHSTSEFTEMLSGLVDKYDPRHLERLKKEVALYNAEIEIINMPCYNPNDLFEQHKYDNIDYLSIDTEGNELEILKAIDYNRYKIAVIGVENNFDNPAFKAFLHTKGYKLVKKLGGDEIYIHKMHFKIRRKALLKR